MFRNFREFFEKFEIINITDADGWVWWEKNFIVKKLKITEQ